MRTASERIRQRLKKDRQMTVISIRIPEDVIEELKEIAPSLGFSGYQPLIRAYIGQGLRKDQARLENSQVQMITDSLRKHGIADQVISAAIAEAQMKSA
jgi:metal-responsive CopG/Arc/MetJ family transcriptional regulator